MLTRRTAPKIIAANNDGVIRFVLIRFHKSVGVRCRETDEGIGTKLLVLFRIGRNKSKVFGGNDLVGIDIIADNIAYAVKAGGGRIGGCGGAAVESGEGGKSFLIGSRLDCQGFREHIVLGICGGKP